MAVVLRTELGCTREVFIFAFSFHFMVKDFKRLDIWTLSIDLNKGIYEVTRSFLERRFMD